MWTAKHTFEAECRCKILAEEFLRLNPRDLISHSLTLAANNLACACVFEEVHFRSALWGAGFSNERVEAEVQLIRDLAEGRKARLSPDQTTLYRDKRRSKR